MHFMVFDGVVPKLAPKTVKDQHGVVAENSIFVGQGFFPIESWENLCCPVGRVR